MNLTQMYEPFNALENPSFWQDVLHEILPGLV